MMATSTTQGAKRSANPLECTHCKKRTKLNHPIGTSQRLSDIYQMQISSQKSSDKQFEFFLGVDMSTRKIECLEPEEGKGFGIDVQVKKIAYCSKKRDFDKKIGKREAYQKLIQKILREEPGICVVKMEELVDSSVITQFMPEEVSTKNFKNCKKRLVGENTTALDEREIKYLNRGGAQSRKLLKAIRKCSPIDRKFQGAYQICYPTSKKVDPHKDRINGLTVDYQAIWYSKISATADGGELYLYPDVMIEGEKKLSLDQNQLVSLGIKPEFTYTPVQGEIIFFSANRFHGVNSWSDSSATSQRELFTFVQRD